MLHDPNFDFARLFSSFQNEDNKPEVNYEISRKD